MHCDFCVRILESWVQMLVYDLRQVTTFWNLKFFFFFGTSSSYLLFGNLEIMISSDKVSVHDIYDFYGVYVLSLVTQSREELN